MEFGFNAAKTRNPLKFAGVPQTTEPISAAGGPKFTVLCVHVEEILLLNKFFPSNRHHRSSGDCLEGKGENYQVCSVQYCVQQLCTVRCTHI